MGKVAFVLGCVVSKLNPTNMNKFHNQTNESKKKKQKLNLVNTKYSKNQNWLIIDNYHHHQNKIFFSSTASECCVGRCPKIFPDFIIWRCWTQQQTPKALSIKRGKFANKCVCVYIYMPTTKFLSHRTKNVCTKFIWEKMRILKREKIQKQISWHQSITDVSQIKCWIIYIASSLSTKIKTNPNKILQWKKI